MLSQLLLTTLLLLSFAASATVPCSFSGQLSIESTKPFHSVSESDVEKARCARSHPFTESEMSHWLDSQTKTGTRTINATLFGIQLVDESPYLAKLLEALLKNDGSLQEPQKTYSSHCNKVYCAANELFGSKVGVQLLFMLGRFGFNGSHLRIKNADLWKSDELDSVLLTLSDLPKHLIPNSPITYNHQLAHFKRNDSTQADKSQPVANAMIFVFDNWSHESTGDQRYTVFHELGHDLGDSHNLSDSPAWLKASGWTEQDLSWDLIHPEWAISQYAEANPFEDFAESFAAYRYNPETLKKMAPGVYQFFKKNLLNGIEYTKSGNCESSQF